MKKLLVRNMMSELGKLGAAARNKKLSAKQRSDIARKAVKARWDKRDEINKRTTPEGGDTKNQ